MRNQIELDNSSTTTKITALQLLILLKFNHFLNKSLGKSKKINLLFIYFNLILVGCIKTLNNHSLPAPDISGQDKFYMFK